VACLPFYSTWTQPPTAPLELPRNMQQPANAQVPNINRVNAIVDAALDRRDVAAPRSQNQEKFGKTFERFSGEVSAEWSSSLRNNHRYEGIPFALTARSLATDTRRTLDYSKSRSGYGQTI
ncbi:unnamed protein product, partial [Cladocopium goreaui]